jgi:hypothetical protein
VKFNQLSAELKGLEGKTGKEAEERRRLLSDQLTQVINAQGTLQKEKSKMEAAVDRKALLDRASVVSEIQKRDRVRKGKKGRKKERKKEKEEDRKSGAVGKECPSGEGRGVSSSIRRPPKRPRIVALM